MWKTLKNSVKITPGTSNGRIYELPSLEPTLWRFQTSLKSVAVCSPSWKRLRLNSLGEAKIRPRCREHVLDKKQKKQMFVCHWLINIHLHHLTPMLRSKPEKTRSGPCHIRGLSLAIQSFHRLLRGSWGQQKHVHRGRFGGFLQCRAPVAPKSLSWWTKLLWHLWFLILKTCSQWGL